MIKIKFKKERKLNRSIIRKSGAIGSLLYLSRNVESVRKQMLQIEVRSSTFKKYTQNTTHRCYLKYKSMMKNGLMMFVMICWHKNRTFTTKSDNQKQKGMLKWNIKLVWSQRDLGKLLQDQDRAQVQDHQDHQRVIKPWKKDQEWQSLKQNLRLWKGNNLQNLQCRDWRFKSSMLNLFPVASEGEVAVC